MGRVTKKMRQTAHSSLWDTIISQHYTFLLDLCLCENYRHALGPFKKKEMTLSLKKERRKMQHTKETKKKALCSGMGWGKKDFT